MLKRSIFLFLCFLVLGSASSAFAGLDPSLAAWWPFDEGEGTIAYDATGNGNDGVFNGDPQWVPGVLGSALEFDGDDYLNCGNGPTLQIQDAITMAFWFNVDAFVNTWEGFMAKGDNSYRASRGGGTGNATHMGISGTSTGGGNGWFNGTVIVTGGDWHHYAATYDGAEGRIYIDGVLDVISEGSGQINISTYDLYIGENSQATGRFFHGILDDIQIYNRALDEAEINSIMTGLADLSLAQNPNPPEEATDVLRDVVLTWEPGETAATHDVYFGTVLDDVNNASRADPRGVLVSQGQADTAYDPDGLLEFGQTYYWRIDEVNAAPDNTIFKGKVWSFTAEPFAYPIPNVIATSNGASDAGVGPDRTVDGSGLNENDEHSTVAADMWLAVPGAEALQIQYDFDGVYKLHEMLVWNYNVQFELMLGFGLKDVTVEYSADGENWTLLGDVTLNQATAKGDYAANTAVAFGGVPARHVRLTVVSGYGPMGQFGLSEVRFMFIPAQAREPQPADGATDVLVGTDLSWRAGREAVTHDVYLGTDELALFDSVAETSITPGNLEFGATYTWRIDEVNEADEVTVWEGPLWTFDTQEYAVIDDFESYDDEENRIYDTWLDGFVNGTGSTVGYFEAPFAEQTIVNRGAQSMPLGYDNSAAPFYSEAEFDLGSLNLDTNGAETLRLFVSGQAPAFLETADGTILMNGIGADIWGNADEFRYVYRNLTGDGSITARVDALDGSMNDWAKGGVMIRQSVAVGAQHAFTAMTGSAGGGAAFQRRIDENGASTSDHDLPDGPFAEPYWVRIERAGSALSSFISADGETWVQAGDTLTIEMQDAVLIGLALTSHNANVATSAEFSNVSFTGSVSGDWQIAEIGIAQPEGNIPDALYVAVEDTSGNVATVTHPDAGITGRSAWTEWLIPYDDLAGVNLGRVATMFVGIGDRDNPVAGGTGTVFIDDVGYGRPAPALTVGSVDSAEITGDDGMVLSINGIAVENLVLGTTSTDFEKFADHPAADADDFDLGTYASLDDSSFINMVFSVPVSTIFIIERGANDLGFIQALDAAGDPVGAPVAYAKSDWFKPGVKINGNQDAGAIAIQAKDPIYGVKILPPTDANMGLDPASVSAVAAP